MTISARLRLERAGFALEADLALPTQGVSAVFGPSGSGKTTLLRCIAGLERAVGRLTVGDDTWQDADSFLPAHKRPLGYVFQDANLFAHLDVAGNLAYAERRADRRVAGADVSRAAAVELLGIGTLLQRRPEQLSGGERQRVAIARALLSQPRLLLLDEPLASLDQMRRNEILPWLERLRDELRIPMVYVSHAADEVARLADHLVVMDAGRVVAQGPLTDTLARTDLPIRLGDDAGAVFDATVAERDTRWHLARAEFAGGELWLRDSGVAIGHRVRLRILARDVSLALARHDDVSILNLLPAVVDEIADEGHPSQVLVRLAVGPTPLLARVTRRSAERLGVTQGRRIWAQVKAVALVG